MAMAPISENILGRFLRVHVPDDWLHLAATPICVFMAWITASGTPGTSICASTVMRNAPIDDMTLMYLFMGLFHLSPWLRLLGMSRRPNPILTRK